MRKNIAIIGSGISGLTCGYLLSREHNITLFEANNYLGGHTATVDISHQGKGYAIDTGFIVFNNKTYPNFLQLLKQIGIDKQKTEMSFSVKHLNSGLEYNGHSINSLFAQRRNIINPKFYRFIAEILRFNKLAKQAHQNIANATDQTLQGFLTEHQFSNYFSEHYILPMVAAIWSSSTQEAGHFPLKFFLQFFYNHGLLNVVDRPQWYVIPGGSRSYIPALTQNIQSIQLNTPVCEISRTETGVTIKTDTTQHFDEVILACHSDQALKLLADANEQEQSVLSKLEYQGNEVILHTDTDILPKRKKAWASWNYNLNGNHNAKPAVTYNMNILQGLESDTTFCVTLNQTEQLDPSKILKRFEYDHPVFNHNTITAQQQRASICGVKHTHFCGAYWYNGFHEDGVRSALDVCQRFGVSLQPVSEHNLSSNGSLSYA